MNGKAASTPVVIRGFYQPHQPVRFDGLLLNPSTGEYVKPVARTKQDFRDECDINNIIKAFTLTGQISHISAKAATGVFADLPDDLDFQTAMNVVARASEAFDALPAKIRDRFHNNPAEFLAFVEDPANADELVQLGIRDKPPRAPAPEPASGSGGDGGRPPVATTVSAPAAAPGGSNQGSGGQAS